jgi:hypothetical protein
MVKNGEMWLRSETMLGDLSKEVTGGIAPCGLLFIVR